MTSKRLLQDIAPRPWRRELMAKSQLISMLQAAAVLLSPTVAGAADKLPALGADPARTSVSGLSSGAFMAVQYDVAYSSTTRGIGVVAGGPYNCAFVNVGGIATCMQGIPLGSASYEAARGFAAIRQIDPVENLAKSKVYLFSGTNDPVVKQSWIQCVIFTRSPTFPRPISSM
jgi:hypothetical protein